MKKLRYVIVHHPGLFTALFVEDESGKREQIEDRLTWAETREYCRRSLEQRGIKPVIEKPDHYTEIFPWIEVEMA